MSIRRVVKLLSMAVACSAAALVPAASAAQSELPITEAKQVIRERTDKLSQIGEGVPGFAGWTKEYADNAVDGVVNFHDDIWVNTGTKDIDWSGGQFDHVEWAASLNRFFHLNALAAAYAHTHEEKYAQAARAYIEDWIGENPSYPDQRRPGDNTLTMGIRLRWWGHCLPAFLDSATFDDALWKTIFASMSAQGRFLCANLPGGNWRIAALDGLILTGLRFPFIEGADTLLETGVRGMNTNASTQFLSDGAQIERTPGYHTGVLETALKYSRLARLFPESGARVDAEALARGIDYTVHSALSGFGDSEAPQRDPEDLRLHWRARQLKELFPALEIAPAPPLEQVFPAAGQVFLRSEWKPGADYLAFDAGSWWGGHMHLSRLALAFRAGGRLLVADPGCFTYEMSDPFARYGRSTPAHSTLNLNGWSQSEADAQLLKTDFTVDAAFMHGRYSGGYWPGEHGWNFTDHGAGVFGIHDRLLFWIKGEYLLALDTMNTLSALSGNAVVHNVWQMGRMDAWDKDESALAWWSTNEDSNIFLKLIPFREEVQMQCFEGSKDPLRGWVGAHSYGQAPAPLVDFSYPCVEGGHCATTTAALLVPYAGPNKPAYVVKSALTTESDEHRELAIALPDGCTDLFVWSVDVVTACENMPSGISSDSPFVWLRLDAAGKPVKGYQLDGSFVTYKGNAVLNVQKRKSAATTPLRHHAP